MTDRYTKAIEQLGSDKLDVRIGGIYALERIARDSARDHPTVMEVLTAFIREHSHEQWPPSDQPAGRGEELSTRPDVQAALTVVGRRDPQRDVRPIDLTDAVLTGAHLIGADLTDALLPGADLTGAHLAGAHLTRAFLIWADLTGANLAGAIFTCASLAGADLIGADLAGAVLIGADLAGADLTRAIFTRAGFTDADLTDADLTDATWPEDTPVPGGWELDTSSGRLRVPGSDSGPAEAMPAA